MACFKSTAPKTKTGSTINQTQQAGLQEVIDWITPYLRVTTAGSPYPGQLTADIPQSFLDAYGEFTEGRYDDVSGQTIQDLISGKPAYEFDPVKTAARW